jgi:hypothetical protein
VLKLAKEAPACNINTQQEEAAGLHFQDQPEPNSKTVSQKKSHC